MLKVENLYAQYGDLKVLWNLSLEVYEKEVVALIGSNGSGKTTLLRVITGLLRPSKGIIKYKGVSIDNLSPHEIVNLGISMVPEGRRIFPMMTVLANLEMGAYLPKARKFKERNLKRVYEIFPILKERTRQIAGSLSGGEQQMLAIGRALMSNNELLLLDEMSLGLAPIIVQNIFDVILEINRIGISILIVEQNVPLTLAVSHRGYVLESGRIVKQGIAKKLFEDPYIKEAYLGLE